ncbi:MAG: hypothetical protein KI790_05025 [Cyclobacteriaceae bacterium]|nr:hypothetical protein [Cyclobacteriaceae bacterium HetDA_MAG_MS6]
MKHFINSVFVLFIVTFFQCHPGEQRQSERKSPFLTKVWSNSNFKVPESAAFDQNTQTLYISNIASKDDPQDGYITKVSVDGEILEEKFITGLEDPKGVDTYQGELYVSDHPFVKIFDLEDGQETARYEIPNAGKLNDLSVSSDGEVFVNDQDNGKTYRVRNDSLSLYFTDTTQSRPNGVLSLSDGILLTYMSSGDLVYVNDQLRSAEILSSEIGAGDGIESDGHGNYFITDFKGRILHYSTGQTEISVLLDVLGQERVADPEYIPSKTLLIVPRHKDNTVDAYQVKFPEGI